MEGDQIFKLASHNVIKNLLATENEINKKEAVKLSIEYQICCEETAFAGVIKQTNKSTGEMKEVSIPIVQAATHSNYENPDLYSRSI